MKRRFIDVIKSKFNPGTVEINVEDEDEITDEIIKSLHELKDAYDLPTEEVESAVKSRNLRNS